MTRDATSRSAAAAALIDALVAAGHSPAAAARRTRRSSAVDARLERRVEAARSSRWSRYSTPKKAYDALTAAFAADLRRARASSFSQSFGASGSQSRAVDSGQPADVVAFSTTPDMTRLVKDGIVAKSWDANP